MAIFYYYGESQAQVPKKSAREVSAVDCNGRTIWIADAHRDDGKRFNVRADEKPRRF
jgi:hypothetical protein